MKTTCQRLNSSTSMLIMISLALLASCKAANNSSLQANQGNKILVIVHGGYNSCLSQNVPEKDPLYYNLATGIAIDDGTALAMDAENLGEGAPQTEGTAVVDGQYDEPLYQDGSAFENLTSEPLDAFGYGLQQQANSAPRRRLTPLLSDMNGQLQALSRNFAGIDWIITCYAAANVAANDRNNIYVSHSGNPTRTYLTSRNRLWSLAGTMAQGASVFVVGHSFGGWTALQTVLKPALNVTSVISIDPVSAVLCPPGLGIFNNNDCKRFPQDITAQMQAAIGQETNHWLNYHVTPGIAPYSSATGAADNAIAAQLIQGVVHTRIDTHATPWTQISNQLRAVRAAKVAQGG